MSLSLLRSGRRFHGLWRRSSSSAATVRDAVDARGGSAEPLDLEREQSVLGEINRLAKEVNHTVGVPYPREVYVEKQNRLYELAKELADSGSVEGKVREAECRLWGFGVVSRPSDAYKKLQPLVHRGNSSAHMLMAKILREGLEEKNSHPNLQVVGFGRSESGQVSLAMLDVHGNPIYDDEEDAKTGRDLRREHIQRKKEDPNYNAMEQSLLEDEQKTAWRDEQIKNLYQRAIVAGESQALVELADYLLKKEPKESLKLYEEAAKRQLPMGYYRLGELYYGGHEGIDVDHNKSRKYFSMAASMGDANACFFLGLAELEGTFDAQPNMEEGMKLLKHAVSLDHPKAILHLARLYGTGAYDINFSTRKYLLLLEKAGELGNGEALNELGNVYLKGEAEQDVDYKKAVKYFHEGMYHKNADATYACGVMYYHGYGTKKSRYTAHQMFGDAAEQGHVAAMRSMGMMLIQGDGVMKNEKLGKNWLDAADAAERSLTSNF